MKLFQRVFSLCQPGDVMERGRTKAALYTVKLTRAKLPANAGNFTRELHVKRPHTQFTCVTFSLNVKTGKFTRVYAANTSRRIHANCLQPQLNLPEYNGYFTSNFTCGTHKFFPDYCAIFTCFCRQNYMQLGGKNIRNLRQKCLQSQAKIPARAGKTTCNRRKKYVPLKLKIPKNARNNAIIPLVKLDCILQVELTTNCVLNYQRLRVFCVRFLPRRCR